MAHRVRALAGLAAALGLLFTALVIAVPFLRFTYDNLPARVALETVQVMIAGLVAELLFGRFRRTRAWRDLVLAYAVALMAVTSAVAIVVPIVAGEGPPSAVDTWTGVVVRLVSGGALLVAAVGPDRPAWAARNAGRWLVGAVCLTVAVPAAALRAVESRLPDAVETFVDPQGSSLPDIDGHPVLLAAQLVLLALLVFAAMGFARRAVRTGDDLLAAFAVAAVLGAIARLNYFLYPSLYTEHVHTGDLVRLAFYLVLLVGAEREIRAHWRDRAEMAMLDERRRVARELHDGLAQDLSLIRSHTTSIARGGGRTELLPLVAEAADRALRESRQAIAALTAANGEPLDRTVRRAVLAVTERAGVEAHLALAPGIAAGAVVGAAVAGVAREATVEAVRRGGCSELEVELTCRDDVVRLVVRSDGHYLPPLPDPVLAAAGPGASVHRAVRAGRSSLELRLRLDPERLPVGR